MQRTWLEFVPGALQVLSSVASTASSSLFTPGTCRTGNPACPATGPCAGCLTDPWEREDHFTVSLVDTRKFDGVDSIHCFHNRES